MRIALVTDGIWPYVLGGMQKHSYYLCKYLALNRVHVHLYHFNQSNYDISQLQFFSAEEKAFIHPVVIPFERSNALPGHYLYDSYRYSKKVSEHLRTQKHAFDLIYTKGFTGWHLLRGGRKHLSSPTVIAVNFHGYEMFQRAPGFKILLQYMLLFRRPVKMLNKRADLVFSYGGKITGIIESLGVSGSRIIELPTGVEKKMLADGIMPTADIRRFLFLGRYERRKGIEELSSAIKLLSATQKERAEFHFIGPIPFSRQVPGCKYHGEVRDPDQLTRLIRGCDVLVCPSWSEGMPNVLLEAMAQGLAVISTNVGATALLAGESTGWLLKDGRPQTIKDAIVAALNLSTHELDQRKHRALELVRTQFVWENIVSRLQLIISASKPI